MKSLPTIVAVLAALALIGAIGATALHSVSAAAFDREQFTKLTDDMKKRVLDAGSANPTEPDTVQKLLDEFRGKVMALFQNSSASTETK